MTTPKAPETVLPPVLWRRAASSVGATLAVLLLPKCPLCVAAYLMSLGVGLEAAYSAAPYVRPLACGLMLLALAGLATGLTKIPKHISSVRFLRGLNKPKRA